MTKFLLAGAAMLAVSTAALADEPQKLSDDQLGIVAGGFNNDNGNHGLPSIPALLLFVTTTDQNTQTNWANSDQLGAAVTFGGLAGVFQHSVINQQNVN